MMTPVSLNLSYPDIRLRQKDNVDQSPTLTKLATPLGSKF